MLLCAVTRPWPRRLNGGPPSSRCCPPLVAATLARATRARSVGRRFRDGSTLGRRSARRPSPPAPNAALLLCRASLRGRTPVAATARRPPAVESLLPAARRGNARARYSRPLGRPPLSRRLDTRPPLDAAAFASCAERSASLVPCVSARSHARGRDGSTAARRRVAAARHSSRRRSRALLAPARSFAAFAAARHSAATRRGGLRLLHEAQRVSCAVPLCAVTRPWPRRLDGRPPSSRCCSPLVAATLARAARARSVGRRSRDGSTLGRRSTRRPSPPALNATLLLCRASLRGHTPVAATARRPPAVESLLLATRHGDARARCSRPLGPSPRSRRLGTQPPLAAAAFASGTERSTPFAPCFSARSHARGRDGSTAARRRVAAARRSSRRRSRALLAPARSAAAFATARQRGGLRLPHWMRRISCAVLLRAVTRPWPRRLDGRPPSSRCCSPLVAATLARATHARAVGRRVRDGSTLGRRSTRLAFASCAERGASLAPCFSAQSRARGRDGSTAAGRRVAAARRSSRRHSRALLAPARSGARLRSALAALARRSLRSLGARCARSTLAALARRSLRSLDARCARSALATLARRSLRSLGARCARLALAAARRSLPLGARCRSALSALGTFCARRARCTRSALAALTRRSLRSLGARCARATLATLARCSLRSLDARCARLALAAARRSLPLGARRRSALSALGAFSGHRVLARRSLRSLDARCARLAPATLARRSLRSRGARCARLALAAARRSLPLGARCRPALSTLALAALARRSLRSLGAHCARTALAVLAWRSLPLGARCHSALAAARRSPRPARSALGARCARSALAALTQRSLRSLDARYARSARAALAQRSLRSLGAC